MIIKKLTGALVAAGAMGFAVLPASAHSHCARYGTSATAVTSELATVLAKEALYNANAFAGRKAKGPVSVNCKYVGVVTTCKARQVACK